MNTITSLLLAHVLEAGEPANPIGFRRLVDLRGQLGGITAACYLLYRPADSQRISVWGFLSLVLPRLLLQLSRTTEIRRVDLDDGIRGRIDWAATLKARYAADSGTTVYVCQQSRRQFDRPENQLLKFMLKQIEVCLARVPDDLRSWDAWLPARDGGRRLVYPLAGELAEMAQRVHVLRGTVYLKEVTTPPAIGSQHILAARTSKDELYAQVADLYDLYRQVVEAASWQQWALVVQQAALLPPGMDEATRQLVVAT